MALLIGSEGSESKSGTEAEQSQNLEQLENLLIETRKGVIQRLKESTNPYHNYKHTEEVVNHFQTLLANLSESTQSYFDERKKLLSIDVTWRHDDKHIGQRHRQEKLLRDSSLRALALAAGEDPRDSNEEYAVKTMRKELLEQEKSQKTNILSEQDHKFMEELLLATTFGQNDITILFLDQIDYLRPYNPESIEQKLLALADVSSFMDGWESWLENSFLFLEESLQDNLMTNPRNFDSWLIGQKNFLEKYVTPLLEKNKDSLNEEFYLKTKETLRMIIERISTLIAKPSSKQAENLKNQFENKFRVLLRERNYDLN
ncbi:hypothetical protein GYA19_00780 [Candidatus Beckwithbacteria bacterium]|nr:hypothetical protein [Candidatus Beckwithbacteria bacterium]